MAIKNTSSSELSDEQLIVGYKKSGDLKLLGDLYGRYLELTYGVCLKYLKTREAAQDAVMQVFEELVNKLKKHDPLNFKSWLYTVVKNHCLMQLRKKATKFISLDDNIMQSAEEMHPEDRNMQEVQFALLSKCIETLSDDQKTTIQLFYLQEKCYKEIVEMTGVEMNKVRSRIQNGKRNLKICMERSDSQNLKS